MITFLEYLSDSSSVLFERIIENHGPSLKKLIKKTIKAGFVDDEIFRQDLIQLANSLNHGSPRSRKKDPDVVERPQADMGSTIHEP